MISPVEISDTPSVQPSNHATFLRSNPPQSQFILPVDSSAPPIVYVTSTPPISTAMPSPTFEAMDVLQDPSDSPTSQLSLPVDSSAPPVDYVTSTPPFISEALQAPSASPTSGTNNPSIVIGSNPPIVSSTVPTPSVVGSDPPFVSSTTPSAATASTHVTSTAAPTLLDETSNTSHAPSASLTFDTNNPIVSRSDPPVVSSSTPTPSFATTAPFEATVISSKPPTALSTFDANNPSIGHSDPPVETVVSPPPFVATTAPTSSFELIESLDPSLWASQPHVGSSTAPSSHIATTASLVSFDALASSSEAPSTSPIDIVFVSPSDPPITFASNAPSMLPFEIINSFPKTPSPTFGTSPTTSPTTPAEQRSAFVPKPTSGSLDARSHSFPPDVIVGVAVAVSAMVAGFILAGKKKGKEKDQSSQNHKRKQEAEASATNKSDERNAEDDELGLRLGNDVSLQINDAVPEFESLSHDFSDSNSGWSNSRGLSSLGTATFDSLTDDEMPAVSSMIVNIRDASRIKGDSKFNHTDIEGATREDLMAAIEAGDWALVGNTAALIASAERSVASFQASNAGLSLDLSMYGSLMSQVSGKSTIEEFNRLVESNDWEGVIRAANMLEGTSDSESTTLEHLTPSALNKKAHLQALILELIKEVVPDELDHVEEMLGQFKNREEELVETLRLMQEKNVEQRKSVQNEAEGTPESRANVSSHIALDEDMCDVVNSSLIGVSESKVCDQMSTEQKGYLVERGNKDAPVN